ncbi:ABC transporter permease [Nocardia sp. NPDC049220]|uniref:ABC transporter permease n=1 Tax=Nocardia sp. NPDC049220 TaxID=3155273 RepID=UPI0033E1B0EB
MSATTVNAAPLRPGVRLSRTYDVVRKVVLFAASPVILLILWQVLATAGVLDARFFPAPSAIFDSLRGGLGHGTLLHDTVLTTGRLAMGLLIGGVSGLVVGIAMGLSQFVQTVLRPLVSMTYPIPKIAILPLFLIIFGLGETAMWAIVSVGVFYPVALNAYAGIREIDPIHRETAAVYRVSLWRRISTVALPGSLSLILTGFELGIGVGFLLVVAAEFMGSSAGLGHAIWQSWQTFAVSSMYAALAVIAIYGLVIQLVMSWLHRTLVPWRTEH